MLKIQAPFHTYFLTLTVVGWVDLLARKYCKDLIVESLKYCTESKGLVLYAYVIMSNHIHLIASAGESSKGLQYLLGDFKKFTSRKMIDWMLATKKESRRRWMLDIFKSQGLQTYRNESFQIWNHYNHPFIILNSHYFNQKLNYIHMNPVVAGLVRRPEDYIYSSAGNYAGNAENVLAVTMIDLGSSIGEIRG